MTDLAIIIVTWNVRELVLDALRTLYDDLAQSDLHSQVIVVDSASSDDTVTAIRATYPQVQVIASDENLGFAGGNNRGLQALGFGKSNPASISELPSAVYLLNPDTLTQTGATRQLFDTLMADDRNGVVGARLSYGDGRFQHASFHFPGLRQLWVEFFPIPGRFVESSFNGRYPRSQYEAQQPFEVDFMLGATMMLRREVIQQTGMFDPQFFMYAEEVDWQWRIRNAGWRILCVPQAHVVHLAGQSTGQVQPRSLLNLWKSRLYLFEKHYPSWKLAIAKQMIALGMRRKIANARHQHTEPDIIATYQTIYELAQQ